MAEKRVISPERWEWFGFPGHFIGSASCKFHLCTQIGRYLISTVGAYRPNSSHEKDQEIGCGRTFETFVFKAGEKCTVKGCGCGMPGMEGSEVDSLPANTALDAQRNHMKLCRKYAKVRS